MAEPARVGEPLQQDQAHPLGPGRPVGRRRERLAASVGGESALAAELGEHAGGRHHRGAARQRQVALAGAQRLRGQVDGHQRGGAGGVHGDRRALQAERVGEPAGGDAGQSAGQGVALVALGRLVQARSVLLRHHADVDAGAGAAQRGRQDPGALGQLPGGLQQQPLLRVHGGGLARAEAEEGAVEAVRLVQEAALAGVGGAGAQAVGVVERVQVPAAVVGEGADRVAPGAKQLPERLGAVRAARPAAAQRDDRDRVPGDSRAPRDRLGGGRAPAQVVGQRPGGGPVVGEGGGQRLSGAPGEAVAQLDGGDRVEPEVLEAEVGVDGLGP